MWTYGLVRKGEGPGSERTAHNSALAAPNGSCSDRWYLHPVQQIADATETPLGVKANRVQTQPVALQFMLLHQGSDGPLGADELLPIDAPQWPLIVAGADLDHQQGGPSTGHDIEFAAAAEPVAGDNAPATYTQMPSGPRFGLLTDPDCVATQGQAPALTLALRLATFSLTLVALPTRSRR